jgi:predicted metal-dependent hydrolase
MARRLKRPDLSTLRWMRETVRTITVDGATLRVLTVRKRVRNVNVRLVGNELRVSAPLGVERAELEATVRRLARTLVRRERAERINSDDQALAIARKVAERFPKPPRIRSVRFVTTQRARWGSYCPSTGLVRLHAALRQLPVWVL